MLLLVRPGEFEPLASGSEYYGQEATVTLLDVKDEGVQTFEQTKDSLKVFYARQKLRNTENDSVKSR